MTEQPLIFLVNDNHKLMRQAQLVLQDGGYRTVLWTVGDDPLQIIKSRQPDLVVIDVWHDGDSEAGWRLIESLRRDSLYGRPPLLITTEEPGTTDRAQQHYAGETVSVLKKPYDWDVMLGEIRNLLEPQTDTSPSRSSGG